MEPSRRDEITASTGSSTGSNLVVHPRWGGVRLVATYARRHPRPFVLGVSGGAMFGLSTVGSSWALARLTDDVIRPAFAGRNPPVAAAFALFIGMGILRVVSGVMRRANAAFLRYDNLATWQELVVRRLIEQPLSFLRRHGTGHLLGVAETDALASVEMLGPLPYAIGSVVLLITAAVWMVWIDWMLGLVALALLPCLAFSNHLFQRRIDAPAAAVQQQLSELAGSVHEMVDGFGVVKALGLEQRIGSGVHEHISTVMRAKIRERRIRVFYEFWQEVMLPVVQVLILLLGAYRVRAGAATIGQIAGLLGLFNLLVWPLRLLAFALAEVATSQAGARRIQALVDEPIPAPAAIVAPLDVANAFELEAVDMVHDDGRLALDGVTLRIRTGSTVAVVGATGSGKSTLISILAGLERPTAGVVRSAQTRVAAVFQEPIVLSGPLSDSLTMGHQVDRYRLDVALKVASAEFIDDLPSGLDTKIGERGITLSGGQRQRVALARALADASSVLLLDDTTSSLDAETEERVLHALSDMESHGRQRTVVMVAARPSSISFADEIVVLDRGLVVGHGTHAELHSNNEVYRSLYDALGQS